MPIEKISQLTDVWNSGSYHYDSIKLDVADYASSDDSNLIKLMVNHDEKFAVDKNGTITTTYLSASGIRVTGSINVTNDLIVGNTGSFGYASVNYAQSSSWANTTINSISSSWASSSVSSSFTETCNTANTASYSLFAVSASVTSSILDIRWIDSNTFVDDTNFAISSSMTRSVDLGGTAIGGVFFTANCQLPMSGSSGSYFPAGVKVVAKDDGGNILYDYGVIASIASGSVVPFSASIIGSSSYSDSSSYSLTSSYADAYLPLAGGAMLGTLVLNADPVNCDDAATKNYVDNKVPDTASYSLSSSQATSASYVYFSALSYSSSWATIANSAVSAQQVDPTFTSSYTRTSSYVSTPHSKAVSGYTYLPNGFIMQWGTTGSYTSHVIAPVLFPMPFPNQCLNVMTCWKAATNDFNETGDTWTQVRSYTNSTATIITQNSTTNAFSSGSIVWTAIGY